MLENELSFLVTKLPDLSGLPKKEIVQHYLPAKSHPLRLRKADQTYELTKKLPVDDSVSRKEELTIPLTAEEFGMLVEHSVGLLTKTRYYYPLPGELTAEIDVFTGALTGLIMVEVEFADEASRAAFVPPIWFGRDVSEEFWSSNPWLAGKTIEDVRPHLT